MRYLLVEIAFSIATREHANWLAQPFRALALLSTGDPEGSIYMISKKNPGACFTVFKSRVDISRARPAAAIFSSSADAGFQGSLASTAL